MSHYPNLKTRLVNNKLRSKKYGTPPMSKTTLQAVFATAQATEFICPFCGEWMPPNDRTIEHVVPLSQGGTNDIENLILAHEKCNHARNTGEPL